jgi:hyperosmotically inducible periplasmic protein
MRARTLFGMICVVAMSLAAWAQSSHATGGTEQGITREVRHELNMLPNVTAFDFMAFKVNGSNVTLLGQVTRPVLKSDAENAVKGVEGVEHVDNQIEVLPPSSQDDALRIRLFRAIYEFPQLQKYELGTLKPIRILVKSGHVTLAGVVDNETDKNVAGIRANSVSGIFSVDNQLQVVSNK